MLFKTKKIQRINSHLKKSDAYVNQIKPKKNINKKKYKEKKVIEKGSILILIGNKFNGKKCILLKYSKKGALIVSGPYSINGIPLRRINFKYAIQTDIKIDILGLNTQFLSDKYFDFLKESDKLNSSMQKQKIISLHRIRQKVIDKYLEREIKKNFFLKCYLKTISRTKN